MIAPVGRGRSEAGAVSRKPDAGAGRRYDRGGATSALPMTATSMAPPAMRIVAITVGLLFSDEPVQLS
jgi:hypothetical protein